MKEGLTSWHKEATHGQLKFGWKKLVGKTGPPGNFRNPGEVFVLVALSLNREKNRFSQGNHTEFGVVGEHVIV